MFCARPARGGWARNGKNWPSGGMIFSIPDPHSFDFWPFWLSGLSDRPPPPRGGKRVTGFRKVTALGMVWSGCPPPARYGCGYTSVPFAQGAPVPPRWAWADARPVVAPPPPPRAADRPPGRLPVRALGPVRQDHAPLGGFHPAVQFTKPLSFRPGSPGRCGSPRNPVNGGCRVVQPTPSLISFPSAPFRIKIFIYCAVLWSVGGGGGCAYQVL